MNEAKRVRVAAQARTNAQIFALAFTFISGGDDDMAFSIPNGALDGDGVMTHEDVSTVDFFMLQFNDVFVALTF